MVACMDYNCQYCRRQFPAEEMRIPDFAYCLGCHARTRLKYQKLERSKPGARAYERNKRRVFAAAKVCNECGAPVMHKSNPVGRLVPYTVEGYEMAETMKLKEIVELSIETVLTHFVVLCRKDYRLLVEEEEFDEEATVPVR